MGPHKGNRWFLPTLSSQANCKGKLSKTGKLGTHINKLMRQPPGTARNTGSIVGPSRGSTAWTVQGLCALPSSTKQPKGFC